MPADLAAVDVLVAGAILAVAVALLAVRDVYHAVILFIAFGLLLSLAWARLGAPDLALAEVIIGAGITGALLLDALGALRRLRERRARESDD